MKLTPEDYQEKAVESVLANLAKARRGYEEDGEKTAVGLTAPTCAGKAVIATVVLEVIFLGTPTREPNAEATVLSLTDDCSPNAQTIGKILRRVAACRPETPFSGQSGARLCPPPSRPTRARC